MTTKSPTLYQCFCALISVLQFHVEGAVHTFSNVLLPERSTLLKMKDFCTGFDKTYTFIADSKRSFRRFMMMRCVAEKFILCLLLIDKAKAKEKYPLL